MDTDYNQEISDIFNAFMLKPTRTIITDFHQENSITN